MTNPSEYIGQWRLDHQRQHQRIAVVVTPLLKVHDAEVEVSKVANAVVAVAWVNVEASFRVEKLTLDIVDIVGIAYTAIARRIMEGAAEYNPHHGTVVVECDNQEEVALYQGYP